MSRGYRGSGGERGKKKPLSALLPLWRRPMYGALKHTHVHTHTHTRTRVHNHTLPSNTHMDELFRTQRKKIQNKMKNVFKIMQVLVSW